MLSTSLQQRLLQGLEEGFNSSEYFMFYTLEYEVNMFGVVHDLKEATDKMLYVLCKVHILL